MRLKAIDNDFDGTPADRHAARPSARSPLMPQRDRRVEQGQA
jgi:hypothetical protein